MGYLGATLTQVFTRACRADMSLRDVTIAWDGKWGLESANDVMHQKRTEDFGNLKKLIDLRPASGEDNWLSLACANLKDCASLSLCRKTFKLKGNKKVSYLNWEVIMCFSNFEIPMFYLYGHSMYVSHIAISWLWYKNCLPVNNDCEFNLFISF